MRDHPLRYMVAPPARRLPTAEPCLQHRSGFRRTGQLGLYRSRFTRNLESIWHHRLMSLETNLERGRATVRIILLALDKLEQAHEWQ
jgi:hypothetical protein